MSKVNIWKGSLEECGETYKMQQSYIILSNLLDT